MCVSERDRDGEKDRERERERERERANARNCGLGIKNCSNEVLLFEEMRFKKRSKRR